MHTIVPKRENTEPKKRESPKKIKKIVSQPKHSSVKRGIKAQILSMHPSVLKMYF